MAINPITNLQAHRLTDETVSLTWTNADTYAGVLISLENGNGWEPVADAGIAEAYAVNVCAPNGCYTFRAVGYVGGEDAAPAYSNKVYTTPASPVSVQARRNDSDTVTITLDNSAQLHATSTIIQRKEDVGEWETIATVAPDTEELTDEPGEGRYWYRVANVVVGLQSEWKTTTTAAADIATPNAPVITSPVDGAIVAFDDETLRVEWNYNPIDGQQTLAEVRYSTGGEWEIERTTTEGFCDIPLTETNTELTVMVRCKSEKGDYSKWSAARSVTVRSRPRVTNITPSDTVSRLPITVWFDYADDSGTLAYAVFEISSKSGIVSSKTVSGTSATFTAADMELINKLAYSVRVKVVSTSTLGSEAVSLFKAACSVPSTPRLFLAAHDGSVELSAVVGNDSPIRTSSVAVQRIDPDGSITTIGSGSAPLKLTDPTPPLDCPVQYRAIAYASDGSQADSLSTTIVRSDGRCYVNWGEDFSSYAFCWRKLNVDTGTDNENQKFSVLGRRVPMVFFGEQESVKPRISARVPITHIGENVERETTAAWRELAKHKGIAYLRLPYSDGDAMYVQCDVSLSVENERYRMAELSLDCTEVDYGLAQIGS